MSLRPLLRIIITFTVCAIACGASPAAVMAQQQESGLSAARAARPVAPEPSSTTGRNRIPTTPEDSATVAPNNGSAAAPTRGAIPNGKITQLPDATKAEIAEATGVYNTCASGGQKDYYDCDCMSLTFLQRRIIDRVTGNDTGVFMITEAAKKSCPNPVAISGRTYTTCMGWAPKMRPDYEEFCECYAKAYAANFSKNPATTISSHKYLMTSSLSACNAGGPVADRMTRNKRIEELKKQGLYEQMFPSAKELPQATSPQAAKPGSAQIGPAQRLTDRLFDQSTPRDMPRQ